jgi:hypothetical protein
MLFCHREHVSGSLPGFSVMNGWRGKAVRTFWDKELESCSLQVLSGLAKTDSGD